MKKHTQSPYESSKVSYKPSGIEWLGEIPQSWEVVKGAFVFSNKKELNSKLQCQERLALTLNGVVEKDINQNDGLNPMDFSTYQIFEKNDLVFKLIDLDNVNTSRVGYVYKKGIMSSAYIRLIIGEKSYAKFFYYYYFSLYINQVFNNLGTGVRATLNADELLAIKIPLPPLQEQKEIAEFLDKKCEKIQNFIDKKQKLITLLQEKKQALINQAVTKGLNPNIESKPSGIEYLGLIPHHWEVKKLKYIATLRNQKSNDSDFKVGLENIESQTGKYIPTTEVVFEDSGIYFYKNDILFGKLRPYLAKVFLADREGVCVGEFLVLTPKKQCGNFLKFLMLSPLFIRVVDGSTYGSKMPRASWEFIGNLKIPLPPLHEQKEIAAFLDSKVAQIDLVIEKTKKQIELVKEYKNTLINEAVCGRINLERK
ncbi:restriction endonuclease subunit S [Campylobacter vulpis]|uniref:Restriction endonuclease subunit S n=1 Tax=Campylobacter vulpis TaxID=1655500 RepID=A0ABS5P3D4_9BACT|nr:restriction endonuclease subunit S [Campylobacter vulpis]MBS4241157.1 restriction endonuclease subunit S [Campylobacter vulpis]